MISFRIIYQDLSYRIVCIRVSSNLVLRVIKNHIESFKLEQCLITLRSERKLTTLA